MSQNPNEPPQYGMKVPPPPYDVNPPHGASVYPPQAYDIGVPRQSVYPPQPHEMGVPPQSAYPPQPQAMGAPDPSQPQVVINQVPVIISTALLGTNPVRMQCPSCQAYIQTQVDYEPTTNTHMTALILCLIGGLCCVWIPYCMDSCQGAKHTCPSCGAYIGTYNS